MVSNIQSIEETISSKMSQVPKGEEQDEPQKSCDNLKSSLMIVKIIANKSDHKCVAKSLKCKLKSRDLPNCICYMEYVKEYYGFDHIITIRKHNSEIIFLDCYGHVFI